MKIKIEASPKEKKIAIITGIIILVILFCLNKKYIYVLDVEFEDNGKGDLDPSKTLIKSGFIFPVKTELNISQLEEKKVKWYGYTLSISKAEGYYDLLLNSKSIHKFYPNSYYESTKTKPTGKIN